jgi:hypothetical protein
MDARNDLFVYLGSTLATIAGLFAVQLWYESYLDVSVIHAQDRGAAIDAKLSAVRAAEQQKLSSGRIPIEQAMSAYAQRGRAASPKLAVKASPEDLSAMAGWIHRPNFAPYVPRRPVAPPAAEVAPGAEGAVEAGAVPAAEGAAPAAEGVEHGAAPNQPPAAPGQGVIPSAPAGVQADAAKTAAERVRPLGERAPTTLRRAPATGAPAPSAAP